MLLVKDESGSRLRCSQGVMEDWDEEEEEEDRTA